ncbi:hypothetical protein JR316_0007385 [Psilocybe cubensis]|uniref:Uncharacterized protein n=2 Tax=Psilocybe cubensis TaxID=181762 RepID=A0ACB8H0R7_PSICU|nr:hypothetical protein JR316_0007385 [Psilocybe cubensis]KAH9480785.1 hypothetical protein JR316_0007385 [Psilocybe cubensis]
MSNRLDVLAQNNNRPPDEAVSKVKELLSGPWKQIDDAKAEIRRLESRAEELRLKATEIEQSITHYECILAPVRRLPPEILYAIFEHSLPTHRNPTMVASECPMLLTRICSNWRSLALSSPRLWARIHIPFLTEGALGDNTPDFLTFSSSEVCNVLRLRCDAVSEWLLRSGDCSLSISICFVSGFVRQEQDKVDKTTITLFERILTFASRLKCLELHVPELVYLELEKMIHNLPLLGLTQVKVSVSDLLTEGQQLFTGLLTSPNLRHVSIAPHALPNGQLFRNIFAYENKITHLSNHTYCTAQEVLSLLKMCPYLHHGEFSLIYSDLERRPGETINMQYLASLWITEINPNSSASHGIYDLINAPKLQYFDYKTQGSVVPYGEDDHDFPSVRMFIERTPKLLQLSIGRFIFSPTVLYNFLHAISTSLVRLVFNALNVHYTMKILDPFDLRCLIARIDTDSRTVLLPRLEILELYRTRVSDDDILEFATSRMGTIPNVAKLRMVKIVLDRRRAPNNPDIQLAVKKRSHELGIHIDLQLEYLRPAEQVPGYVGFLSPMHISNTAYGARDTVDRTWIFREHDDGDGYITV